MGNEHTLPTFMPLTDVKIRNTKPRQDTKSPLRLADGHGLWLVVASSGAKYWQYRYRIGGKDNTYSIGEYPSIGLSDARDVRKWARDLVKQGLHPSHHRKVELAQTQAENANTFEAVAKEWIAQRKSSWSGYYLSQVERAMECDVYPAIGALPIRFVTAAQVLEILKRVEKRGAETVALLIRQWCSAIFRYAVSTLRAEVDPASALRGSIHRPKVVHSKPLSRDEVIHFLDALDKYGGYRPTVIALRLLLLTFVRTVELRCATWSEFDLERAEWRVPAHRMKMREMHIVPLSTQAVSLLLELKDYTGGMDKLFPNLRRPDTYMTATTVNRALERMGFTGKNGIGFSAHGFRATASTMLNEFGYKSEVIERQLAHADRNKVRASYNQAQYLDERKKMMQEWADYLDKLKDEALGRKQ